jgi:CheY-like chemotaxis protein
MSDPCLLNKIKYETYIYAELKFDSMAQPKVLIVEDDTVILSIEKWRLSNLGNEICGSAGTGAEAMECVAKMQPDIVLMDIHLEGEIDGIETAGRIKEEFDIPVIFVSAHIDEATISRAKAIHPDGFLRKPFDNDDLRIALELGLKK